jgi:phage tail sheath protein FI
MATYVSPGVYTIEKDISEYTPSINTSVVGIVGFAPKGPTNKATLITSQNQLLRTFGEPSEALTGQALEGALEVLETTNQLYFIRAADSTTAADASATMSMGVAPALLVSGALTSADMALNGWGVKRSTTTGSSQFGGAITLRIQSYDNDGTAQFTDNNSAGRDFSVPEGTSETSQAAALKQIIGGDLDSDKVGVVVGPGSLIEGINLSGAIVGSFAGSGASLGVSACSGTSFSEAAGVSALVALSASHNATANYGAMPNFASAVRVYGASYMATGADSVAYEVESLHPGAGYNAGTRSDGTTSGNSVTVSQFGGQNMSVVINQDGTAQETFKTSLVGSGAFIEDVINTGATNLTSDIIKGNIIVDDQPTTAVAGTTWFSNMATIAGTTGLKMQTQTLVPGESTRTGTGTPTESALDTITNGGIWNKLIQATATSLAGGNNGVGTGDAPANALIGNAAVEPKTGMQVLDDPVLNVGFALVPGVQTESVQNALITLASTSQNFMALVSPPYGIGTVSDAIAWTNGQSTSTAGSRSSAINNSYAAVHWPWVKVFSTFDGKDRWYDPSIFAARQFAYTDAVADSWFAPAGFQRGKLSKPTEVEVKLNQGDRDSLYSGGNCINPIVNFPQQGITIFGQRTSQREATALDRINVRRLMIYIRKVIVNSCQRFVFEPNDTFTWSQVEGLVNPFLDDIRRRRGITEFRVVCDETTNTPVRIDRGEMWTKVIVKPTKTAEILIFEINLTNQSADLGTL